MKRINWDPELMLQMLTTRSSGLCEGRTWACIAPSGRLDLLPRHRVSIQHRVARGMGGSARTDLHTLPYLLVLCGDGTSGCHGWVEGRRPGMEERGLWVRRDFDAAQVPVILSSGRKVLLVGAFYEDAGWHHGPIPGDPADHVTAGLTFTEYLSG